MKKYLIIGILVATSLSLMVSCFDSAGGMTTTTYRNSPVWEGSSWAGSGVSIQLIPPNSYGAKGFIVKTVTSGLLTTKTTIQLQNMTSTLTFGTDNTYSFTDTHFYGTNWANTYVSDNLNYSTTEPSYNPPSMAADGVTYTVYGSGYNFSLVDGTIFTSSFSSATPSVATIESIGTTPTTYNGNPVYPVTFKTARGAALSGSIDNTVAVTGTYTELNTGAEHTNKTTYPVLTRTSTIVSTNNFDPTTGSLLSTTITDQSAYAGSDSSGGNFEFGALSGLYGTQKYPNQNGVSVFGIPHYTSYGAPIILFQQ